MNFELFTYGGGDFLRMVFNALAIIFSVDDFTTAIRTMALIGLLVVMTNAAFMKGKLNFQWIIGLVAIYTIVFIPRVTVLINDRVVTSNSAVVANVPLGIAAPAAFFSSAGNWLTEMFETQFALPSEVRYTGNGMLLANSLLEAQATFEIPDSRIAGNFAEFWRTCVYYDLLLGLYTWNDLTSSTNLYDYFAANTSVVRAFTYTNPDGSNQILVCRNGYVGNLQPDMVGQVTMAHNKYGQELTSEDIPANAVAKFAAAMPVALNLYTGISQNAVNTTNQMMLANSLKRGLATMATAADASAAAQEFAGARAQAERNNTFAVMGKLSGKFLPVLRNVFEALIYALSPIVMLMLMLPVAGKVAIGYVKALAWINLWGPLFAVLHFVMTYYSQNAANSAVVHLGGSGLSMSTYTQLSSVLSQHSLVAGYLSVSIPMIAWMVINSSGAMMAGLAGRMMSSYDSSVAGASKEATTGNMNFGNMSYDNVSAMQHNWSPSHDAGRSSHYDSNLGMERTVDSGGHSYNQQMTSNYATSVDTKGTMQNAAREIQSEATALTETASTNLMNSTAAVIQASDAVGHRISEANTYSTSRSTTELNSYKEAQANVQEEVDRFTDEHGFTQETMQRLAAYAGVEAKVGTPLEALFGTNISAVARAGVDVSGSEADKEAVAEIQAFVQSDKYQDAVEQLGQAALRLDASQNGGTTDTTDNSLSAALNEQTAAQEQQTVALQKTEQAQQMNEHVEAALVSINQKGDGDFMAWANAAGIREDKILDLQDKAYRGNDDARAELNGYMENYARDELESVMSRAANYETNSAEITGRGEAQIETQATAGREEAYKQDGENFEDVKVQQVTGTAADVQQKVDENENAYTQKRDDIEADLENRSVETQTSVTEGTEAVQTKMDGNEYNKFRVLDRIEPGDDVERHKEIVEDNNEELLRISRLERQSGWN